MTLNLSKVQSYDFKLGNVIRNNIFLTDTNKQSLHVKDNNFWRCLSLHLQDPAQEAR